MADATITSAGAADKRDTSRDQMVTVKALKSFHKDGDMKGEVVGPDSPVFDVPRWRAAQLRANFLIEYANDSDDKAILGEADAKRIADRVKAIAEQTKLPSNSKTTPLRNPEVKLADAPVDQGKRK